MTAIVKQGKSVSAFVSHVGMQEYVVASACSKIVVPPSAVIEMRGLSFGGSFFRGALDKLGLQPEVEFSKENMSYGSRGFVSSSIFSFSLSFWSNCLSSMIIYIYIYIYISLSSYSSIAITYVRCCELESIKALQTHSWKNQCRILCVKNFSIFSSLCTRIMSLLSQRY